MKVGGFKYAQFTNDKGTYLKKYMLDVTYGQRRKLTAATLKIFNPKL